MLGQIQILSESDLQHASTQQDYPMAPNYLQTTQSLKRMTYSFCTFTVKQNQFQQWHRQVCWVDWIFNLCQLFLRFKPTHFDATLFP